VRAAARVGALALALAAALAAAPAAAQTAAAPAADSLGLFLQDLADSTDAYFGGRSVAFDTTGLDSLLGARWNEARRRGGRLGFRGLPVLLYHRATGVRLGAIGEIIGPFPGVLRLGAEYGFSDQGGRYQVGWRGTLWRSPQARWRPDRFARARIGDGPRVDLEVAYARETLPFMPEHAGRDYGGFQAFLAGTDEQDVYERRGGEAALIGWAGDWRLSLGIRHAAERAMPLATDWSLLGRPEDVVPVDPAREETYTEPFGGVAFSRPDWDVMGMLDARGGGAERWRLRAALGKGFDLPGDLRAVLQGEAGAAPADAPRQRRFELGGARAVPSLQYGYGGGDHLLLASVALISGRDLLRRVGLRPPDFLVLQPELYAQAAAAWDDPARRDVVFATPPGGAWQGTAGFALLYPLGFPDPGNYFKVVFGWPVGSDAGSFNVNLSFRTAFDLLEGL
jgi:hypothetical protein